MPRRWCRPSICRSPSFLSICHFPPAPFLRCFPATLLHSRRPRRPFSRKKTSATKYPRPDESANRLRLPAHAHSRTCAFERVGACRAGLLTLLTRRGLLTSDPQGTFEPLTVSGPPLFSSRACRRPGGRGALLPAACMQRAKALPPFPDCFLLGRASVPWLPFPTFLRAALATHPRGCAPHVREGLCKQ
jgi:hypothetical protein